MFTEFQRLKKYLEQLECKSYHLMLVIHLDGLGRVCGQEDDNLHYYKFGSPQSTPVEWNNVEEEVTIIQEVLATLAVSPSAVAWY